MMLIVINNGINKINARYKRNAGHHRLFTWPSSGRIRSDNY